jgi:GTP 3',8-cyclase
MNKIKKEHQIHFDVSIGSHILAEDKVLTAAWQAIVGEQNLPFPVAVEIQPTTACNYDCPYCSYAGRRKNAQVWKPSQMGFVADQLTDVGVKSVYISGGGEPTLATGIENTVARLHDAGTDIALVTNGSQTSVLCELAPMLRYMLVHFVSANSVEHYRIMGKSLGDKLKLPELIHSTSDCAIGARIVINTNNIASVAPSIETLRKAGYDFILLTPDRPYERNGEVSYMLDSSLSLTLDPILLHTGYVQIAESRNARNVSALRCAASSLGLTAIIDPHGDCYLCIPDVGIKEFSIGNVFEKPFYMLWGGIRHRQVLETVNARYSSGKCRNCRFLESNAKIDQLIEAPKMTNTPFHNFI